MDTTYWTPRVPATRPPVCSGCGAMAEGIWHGCAQQRRRLELAEQELRECSVCHLLCRGIQGTCKACCDRLSRYGY